MISPIATARLLADLVLVLSASPGRACAQSKVLLARVRPGGMFELLSATAWGRALGYAAEELHGQSLRGLLQLETPAADGVLAALLDQKAGQPVELTLRCKDERRKCFRIHRRFDAYDQAMWLLADEVPEVRLEPLGAALVH